MIRNLEGILESEHHARPAADSLTRLGVQDVRDVDAPLVVRDDGAARFGGVDRGRAAQVGQDEGIRVRDGVGRVGHAAGVAAHPAEEHRAGHGDVVEAGLCHALVRAPGHLWGKTRRDTGPRWCALSRHLVGPHLLSLTVMVAQALRPSASLTSSRERPHTPRGPVNATAAPSGTTISLVASSGSDRRPSTASSSTRLEGN